MYIPYTSTLIRQQTLHHAGLSAFIIITLLGSLGRPQITQTVEISYQEVFQKQQFPIAEIMNASTSHTFFATAYSSDFFQTDATPFIPANGIDYRNMMKKQGYVAAIATNDLPLGTQIAIPVQELPDLFTQSTQIPSERIILDDKKTEVILFTVTDRMNAKFTGKSRIDIYVAISLEDGTIDQRSSRSVARLFGSKRLTAAIVQFN
ncbi:hypothetical protein KKG22_03935 [Patescibacteria group bacterium]|nr:hypothetical protein [Patescibacteria group bacterium]MBU1721294.1 hypothetical protein [Patescibacteria group bacterium]MBU1900998.1 hypothetical protein [Patescibacteria group bacterium]